MTSRRVQSDERALVERARSGDREAFSELAWRHQDAVFTLAQRLVGPDLAPDVTQETLVRAWRALPRFRGDAAFGTWIHRITVNTAWTLRKRRARHEAVPLVEDAHVDPSPGPERAGELVEVRAGLREAIGSLSDRLRVVLVLRDIHGWSNQEVAEELGITQTTAKVRLHRARLQVRALLEDL